MAFPKVHITGGPHAKNTELTIDGVKVAGVHRAEITLDVNDIARLRLWQIIEADLDLEVAGTIERKFILRVMAGAVETVEGEEVWTRKVIGEFEGDTTERVFEKASEALVDFVPVPQVRPAPTPALSVVPDA
jgi:hypothetical protein